MFIDILALTQESVGELSLEWPGYWGMLRLEYAKADNDGVSLLSERVYSLFRKYITII